MQFWGIPIQNEGGVGCIRFYMTYFLFFFLDFWWPSSPSVNVLSFNISTCVNVWSPNHFTQHYQQERKYTFLIEEFKCLILSILIKPCERLRNILISNDKGSFPFYIVFVFPLSLKTFNRLDYIYDWLIFGV